MFKQSQLELSNHVLYLAFSCFLMTERTGFETPIISNDVNMYKAWTQLWLGFSWWWTVKEDLSSFSVASPHWEGSSAVGNIWWTDLLFSSFAGWAELTLGRESIVSLHDLYSGVCSKIARYMEICTNSARPGKKTPDVDMVRIRLSLDPFFKPIIKWYSCGPSVSLRSRSSERDLSEFWWAMQWIMV